MKNFDNLRVAIVCDWLTGHGGAERVVHIFHELFPGAPIYTSQYDPTDLEWTKNAQVETTLLQRLPKNLKKFLPVLRAWSFSHLKLNGYDLILSSSGAEAKGTKTSHSTLQICYCHAPTHYYWDRYDEYLEHPGFGKLDFIARIGLKILAKPMRWWDFRAAQRPTVLVTNSNHSKEKIKQYYERDAIVIPPPVNVGLFKPTKNLKRAGFVIAGRQTPYKRFDLAVGACTKHNLPLTVVGNGPDHEKLVKIAGPTITFVTEVSDNQMPEYFQRAEAFIFPDMDDFGIVAVEAMAAGTPVIAFKGGGALDYVVPGVTGEFFSEENVDSLSERLVSFNSSKYSQSKIVESAQKYSAERFQQAFSDLINRELQKKEI